MKRDAILFLAVFVAAFALSSAVLHHNRFGNQLTEQARTPSRTGLQQKAIAQHDWAISMLVTEVKQMQASASRSRLVYRIVSGRADNRLVPELRGLNVTVFADSISCEQLSRSVLRINGVTESSLKSADVALVVVRSSLLYPLNHGYASISALKNDSEMQLNISGLNGHIYVFSIDGGLRATELFHTKFKWNDYQFVP